MAKFGPATSRLLNEFEAATRAHALKGAEPPEVREEIVEQFERAKTSLINHLKGLSS